MLSLQADGLEPDVEALESLRAENDALRHRVVELESERDRLGAASSSTRNVLDVTEQRFLKLLLNIPAAIGVVRPPEMIVELANSTYMEIAGSRDIIGKPLGEAVPEAAAQGIVDLLMRVYTTGEPLYAREVFVKTNPDKVGRPTDGWYDLVYQPVRDAAGTVTAILCHVVEVTDKVLARRAVEELNEKLRVFKIMVDTATDGIGFMAPDGTFAYANEALGAMSGLGDRTTGSPAAALYEPDLFKTVVVPLISTVYERGQWSGTLPATRPDGTRWMAQISGNLVTNPEGKPIGMTGIFRDVTKQHVQEKKLRVLNALVESAPDGFAVANLDRRLLYANRAWRAMSGQGEASIGTQLEALFPADKRDELAAIVEEAKRRGTAHSLLECERRDGSRFPGQVSIFVIDGGESQPLGVAIIVRDVTEQSRTERDRADLQQRLIKSQQEALRELATPLIPLADGVIAMPLIGTVDAGRARQIMETLLHGIASQSARVALLDVTGVRLIDAQTADALIGSAKAAQLLGAEVILTGLSPEVARTLVELDIDLSGIRTHGSFQAGIAHALGRLRGEWTKRRGPREGDPVR